MSVNPPNSSQFSASSQPAATSDASVPASVRGAVDLGAVAAQSTGSGVSQKDSGATAKFRKDVADAQQFQAVAELSTQVPVVLVLTASYAPESGRFADQLGHEVDRLQGRMVLSAVDIEKLPEIAQALQVQTVPTIVAMIAGRPVPIAQSTIAAEQIAPVLQELLSLAEQNGVSGQVEPMGEPEPVALPPLHQEAVDKLEAGDLQGAHAAYEQAIRENPGDTEAKLALAQVQLLQRVTVMDAQAVRQAAASAPEDIQAQLDVADLDVSGGHVEDAFARLLGVLRRSAGDEKEKVRQRLIALFSVVGPEDPRVINARSQLMRALF